MSKPKKKKTESDDVMQLRDCTQGDIVVIVWSDRDDHPLNGTEQIVRVCSTARSKKSTTCMVELIDPETLREYPTGCPELCGSFYNAFAVDNSIEITFIVEHSKHVRVTDEHSGRAVDASDPMQR